MRRTRLADGFDREPPTPTAALPRAERTRRGRGARIVQKSPQSFLVDVSRPVVLRPRDGSQVADPLGWRPTAGSNERLDRSLRGLFMEPRDGVLDALHESVAPLALLATIAQL
jgi:hypothetical protein